MSADPTRLRTDAARNAERLAHAAREVFMEEGPAARLEDVAARAGVGISTLFRRFPDRQSLVRAALELGYRQQLAPALTDAEADDDAGRALLTALEAAMAMGAQEQRLLAAAREAGVQTMEWSVETLEKFEGLFERARADGAVREDLATEDVLRLLVMLFAMLQTIEPGDDGWRRYLRLVWEAVRPDAPQDLPAAPPVAFPASRPV